MEAGCFFVVTSCLLGVFLHRKITVDAIHPYIREYWAKDNAMIGRFTTKDQMFVKLTNSVCRCAAECQKTPGCFSIFFDARRTRCVGNKNPFIDVEDSLPSEGFVLYKREFCSRIPPSIPFSKAIINLAGQKPVFTYSCVANSVLVSGTTTASCQQGTLTWTTPSIQCKDLSVCNGRGYTYIPSIGTCLKFIGNKVSFQMAITTCAGTGGTSIRPDTNTKHNAVASYLMSVAPDYCVWTGGNDRNIEGSYRWADNTPITQFQWNSGEPLPSGTDSNDCIMMWPGAMFKWDDISCNHECYVLCEITP